MFDLVNNAINSDTITGYSKDEIENKLKGVLNELVEEIGKIVTTNLKTGLVEPIKTKWYAKEAQDYFKDEVAPNVRNSGIAIRGLLQDYANAIERAGLRWANRTGNDAPKIGEINDIGSNYDLNVDAIQKIRESDGAAVLYEKDVNDIAAGLTKVEENINDEIKALGNKMNASTSFLGHDQAEEIKKCLDRIIAEIHKMFQSLISGSDPASIAFNLKKFKEKYATAAEVEEKLWSNITVSINQETPSGAAPSTSQNLDQIK
mgnify:CR=1 FL=1